MNKGTLVVISGFSGAGKGTVLSQVLARRPDLYFSVSFTTRPPREGMVDAIKPVTKNPAQMMGIYGTKGCLLNGADADFVLIDPEIRIQRTIIAGETVYQRS